MSASAPDGLAGLDALDHEQADSAQRFAENFRDLAAAVLVQIAMNESAPAYARIQAAREILAYADSRPQTSRPVSVTDLRTLSYNDRLRLLITLFRDPELAHILPQTADAAEATPPVSAPAPPLVPVKFVRRALPPSINGHANGHAAQAPPAASASADTIAANTSAEPAHAIAAYPGHDRAHDHLQASPVHEAPAIAR